MDIALYDTDILGLTGTLAPAAPGLTLSQLVALFFLALPFAAPLAYLVITGLDLREGLEALRARRPCAAKLLKGDLCETPCRGLLLLIPFGLGTGGRRGWGSGGSVRAASRKRCCRRVPGRTGVWSASLA